MTASACLEACIYHLRNGFRSTGFCGVRPFENGGSEISRGPIPLAPDPIPPIQASSRSSTPDGLVPVGKAVRSSGVLFAGIPQFLNRTAERCTLSQFPHGSLLTAGRCTNGVHFASESAEREKTRDPYHTEASVRVLRRLLSLPDRQRGGVIRLRISPKRSIRVVRRLRSLPDGRRAGISYRPVGGFDTGLQTCWKTIAVWFGFGSEQPNRVVEYTM